jgi:hypothetical protein
MTGIWVGSWQVQEEVGEEKIRTLKTAGCGTRQKRLPKTHLVICFKGEGGAPEEEETQEI